jgi:hypothetical protein
MNTKTFYQAILLGIVTILLGLIFSVIFGSLKPELKEECQLWDEYYVMEVVLFFTGVTIRLLLTSDMGNKYLLSV